MRERELIEYLCENCGSNRIEIIVSREDLEVEQELQRKLKQRFYRDPSFAEEIFFVQSSYSSNLVECQNCGLVFRDLRPEEKEIISSYQKDLLTERYNEAWMSSWTGIFERLLSQVERRKPEKGRLLDIGSQLGLFPEIAAKHHWEACGVDPSEYTVTKAKERGVNIFQGVLKEVNFPRAHFDVVSCWTVFENLPHFREDLSEIRQVLKPGGLFTLKVSNFEFYRRLKDIRSLTKDIIFARLHILGFPYQYGFTPEFLRDVLSQEGFEKIEINNYKLSVSLNRYLKPEIILLEKASKKAINFISGSISLVTGGRTIIGPWLEVYAINSLEK